MGVTTQQQKGTKGDTFPGTSCSYLPALLTDNSCLVSLFLLCCLSKTNVLFNILCVSILLSLRTTATCSPYGQQLHALLTDNSYLHSIRTTVCSPYGQQLHALLTDNSYMLTLRTTVCSPYGQQLHAVLTDNSMLSLRTTATCCPYGRKGSAPLREKRYLLSSRMKVIYFHVISLSRCRAP